MKTLGYLQKGGRIGLVASLFSNTLDLEPIISYNDERIHCTVVRVRGRKQLITKTKELALGLVRGHRRCNVTTMHEDIQEMAEEICNCIMKKFSGTDVSIMKQVSPAPGVYIGPGTLGICVQILDET